MYLDKTSLLTSKTVDFLNTTDSTAYEAEKQTASDMNLIESAERKLEPSAQH